MPPPMSSSKKIGVRVVLATGSTLATIIGAQSLAAQQKLAEDIAPEAVGLEPVVQQVIDVDPAVFQMNPTLVPTISFAPPTAFPTVEIPHAVPNIVILRQSGEPQPAQPVMQPTAIPQAVPVQSNVNQVAAASPQILPPQPVVAAAPAPVVVQPDPIYVQPPPVVIQAAASGGGGGGGGGGNRSNSSR